jgi:hypothetical protein
MEAKDWNQWNQCNYNYTLNNFTTHITIYYSRSWKKIKIKIKIKNSFFEKKPIGFVVNVETDPRLGYVVLFSQSLGPLGTWKSNKYKNWLSFNSSLT